MIYELNFLIMYYFCFFSGQYYRRDDFGIRIRPSSRTDSDYHRRFSSSPFPDYSGNNISYYIEMMDPLKSIKL